jgi:hypothetical protein
MGRGNNQNCSSVMLPCSAVGDEPGRCSRFHQVRGERDCQGRIPCSDRRRRQSHEGKAPGHDMSDRCRCSCMSPHGSVKVLRLVVLRLMLSVDHGTGRAGVYCTGRSAQPLSACSSGSGRHVTAVALRCHRVPVLHAESSDAALLLLQNSSTVTGRGRRDSGAANAKVPAERCLSGAVPTKAFVSRCIACGRSFSAYTLLVTCLEG